MEDVHITCAWCCTFPHQLSNSCTDLGRTAMTEPMHKPMLLCCHDSPLTLPQLIVTTCISHLPISPGRPSTTARACVPLPPKLSLNLTGWPVFCSYSFANWAVICTTVLTHSTLTVFNKCLEFVNLTHKSEHRFSSTSQRQLRACIISLSFQVQVQPVQKHVLTLV